MRLIAYDTETTGLFPFHGAEMFGFSTCDEDGRTQVVRIDGSPIRKRQGLETLSDLWSFDPEDPKAYILHNAKFDLHFTEKALGGRLDGALVHDTHKLSHILQSNHPSHGLKELTWELAEYPRDDERRVKDFLRGGARTWQQVPERIMKPYMRGDAERTMLLFQFLWPKIKDDPKLLAEYWCEMDLQWATMRMEARGLLLNDGKTEEMIFELDAKIDTLKSQLYEYAGERINPNSGPQVAKLLYKKMGLPILKRTKKAKEPSTDKLVLMELKEMFEDNEALDLILRIRAYSSGMSTLEEYLELATDENVIHPSINTCAAKTTRESCSHPNLQNVQKSEALLNPYPVPARKCFRPRPGYINIHIDYAGIEARLLVHYSGEPEMLECLNHGDGDLHNMAGETFYPDDFWEVEADRRKVLRAAAKNANFAAPYGASNKKMKQTLGIKSDRPINAYRRRFPLYTGLQKTVAGWVRRDGFVVTAFGRKIYAPKGKAYVGTNFIIQATAAGVLKRAQNRVHEYNEWATDGEVRILLPIHDEIVIEYPRWRLAELDQYLRDVRDLMIDFPEFIVPMSVEAEYTSVSWEDKIDLEILK